MNRTRAAAIAVALALGGCGGSHVTPSTVPPTTVNPQTTTPQGQAAFTYGVDALQGAQYLGPANVGAIGIDITLQAQNASGLVQYARQASTPGSPLYRHFLTPQQIGQNYGASQSTVTAVASYFASYGLHVGTWPQHLSLYVSGAQHAMEQALGTTLGTYKQGSTTFIAPNTTPKFAKTLPVTAITHLVSMPRQFRTFVPPSAGAFTTSGYSPQQVRNAFDFTGAYNAGYTGSGITVGIIGTGPISNADVPAYGAMFATKVAQVTQVNVTDQQVAVGNGQGSLPIPPDTGLSAPPPVTAPCNGVLPACNQEDFEAQIDTEAAASLAPGAQVAFYLGYAPPACATSNGVLSPAPCGTGTTPTPPLIGLNLSDDEIQQAIADNTADVLSLSYGGSEQGQASYYFPNTNPATGLGPMEFAALAAEGIAVFVSSGDAGAEGCQRPVYQPAVDQACVSYPATDPSVTSVGGVNAPLNNVGTLTNQITGWGYLTGGGRGGSGGGVSQYFPLSLTPWQVGPGITGSMRLQPDVSLLGDPATGMAVLANAAFGTTVQAAGGTSVAAPQMAAMWALVLQACAQSSCATAQGGKPYRLGNAAPILYSLYATNATTIAPTYASTFYDVLYGDNQQTSTKGSGLDPGYNAATGYDEITGIGVPFARALIKAVTKQ